MTATRKNRARRRTATGDPPVSLHAAISSALDMRPGAPPAVVPIRDPVPGVPGPIIIAASPALARRGVAVLAAERDGRGGAVVVLAAVSAAAAISPGEVIAYIPAEPQPATLAVHPATP